MPDNPSFYALLTDWCDGLLAHQIRGMADSSLNGAFVCPACQHLHGRGDNAIFPLLYQYHLTGKPAYRDAAFLCFDWQKNLLCDNRAVYNDGNSDWQAITAFSAIGLCKSLRAFSPEIGERVPEWETRLKGFGEWIYHNLTPSYYSNINYQCAAAEAMALLGAYFARQEYLDRAEELLAYGLSHFTENGILYGEGHPHDLVTEHGCRAVDIGYNLEESVPALCEAAKVLGRKDDQRFLLRVLQKQLDFFLPDGGIDNSFSARNYKWTYYGSRTSDGAASAYALFAGEDPRFAEVACRNIDQMARCTHNGLLYGGPDYYEAGEKPCIHHTICHAFGLADALMQGLRRPENPVALPVDDFQESVRYFPELATYRMVSGGFLADFTAYDFEKSSFAAGRGHASGGTMSLLVHRSAGVLMASSVMNYRLSEPLNQQLPRLLARHAPLTLRAEIQKGTKRYVSCLDGQAKMIPKATASGLQMTVDSGFTDLSGKPAPFAAGTTFRYRFCENRVECTVSFWGEAENARLILPILKEKPVVLKTDSPTSKRDIFHLVPGFLATEYTLTAENRPVHWVLEVCL